MAKLKYKYNPKTLSYDTIQKSFWGRLLDFSTYFTAFILVGIILNILFATLFDTPKEKGLKRENSQLLGQYEMLDQKFDQVKKVLKDIQKRDDNIYRTIFGVEPIQSSVREAGFGGINRYAHLEGMTNADIVIESSKRLDKLTSQLYVQSKSFDQIIHLARNKELMLAGIPAIQPLSNKDLTRIASGYGYRIDPIYGTQKFHEGMDFTAPTGTEVYATGDGVVSDAKMTYGGYGNKVDLDHGFGYITRYAHLDKILVKHGQKIKRGDVIGLVGNTGKSVGPHLHYEVIRSGKTQNPAHFFFNDLTPEQYDKVIYLASRGGQPLD